MNTVEEQFFGAIPIRAASAFSNYLIAFRMEKAKEMLGDPQLKIQDIADKLRYTSQQGFMRAFKKSTGMTPGQYRSNLKE